MIFNIKDFRAYSPIYVETGSAHGGSLSRALEAGFKRLKSCELHEPLYRHCIKKFKGKPVELFLGKSTDKLDQMLADVYEPAVIFLDAHPAGPQTGGHEEWLKGDTTYFQDYILKNELQIIKEHRPDHLIIIDDQTKGSPESEYYMAFLGKSYRFEWYDEQLLPTEPYFKDKVLVCEPY